MSYEFGFAKYPYSEDKDFSRSDENVYFFWCGWDTVNIHDYFANAFGEPILIGEDEIRKYYEYKIKVADLDFIEKIYQQVTANDNYNIITKLLLFDDEFAQEYLNSLSVKEKADLRIAFILDDVDWKILNIGVELFYRFSEDGYDMLGSLYKAYQKMIRDGVEYVYLYGG